MRRGDAVLVMVSGLIVGVLATPTLFASGGGEKEDVERKVEVAAALTLPSVDAVFVPIAPVRAFDSRVSGFPGFGILPRLGNRVISVKDGRNVNGAVTVPDESQGLSVALGVSIPVTLEVVGTQEIAAGRGHSR